MMDEPTCHIVVMGVSGCGKSTVARALAQQLGWRFAEGDDFHPPTNLAKMSDGTPLTEADRLPWLESLARWARDRDADGEPTVMSCSALRRRYRDILTDGLPRTFFVHLTTNRETLHSRMSSRAHFMPVGLLDSQLETLEDLEPDEWGLAFDARTPLTRLVDDIVAALESGSGRPVSRAGSDG